MIIPVIKADDLNQVKGDSMRERVTGGRPVRKKGFHRALKRNEWWAIEKDFMTRMMYQVTQRMYGRALESILYPVSLSEMIKEIK